MKSLHIFIKIPIYILLFFCVAFTLLTIIYFHYFIPANFETIISCAFEKESGLKTDEVKHVPKPEFKQYDLVGNIGDTINQKSWKFELPRVTYLETNSDFKKVLVSISVSYQGVSAIGYYAKPSLVDDSGRTWIPEKASFPVNSAYGYSAFGFQPSQKESFDIEFLVPSTANPETFNLIWCKSFLKDHGAFYNLTFDIKET